MLLGKASLSQHVKLRAPSHAHSAADIPDLTVRHHATCSPLPLRAPRRMSLCCRLCCCGCVGSAFVFSPSAAASLLCLFNRLLRENPLSFHLSILGVHRFLFFFSTDKPAKLFLISALHTRSASSSSSSQSPLAHMWHQLRTRNRIHGVDADNRRLCPSHPSPRSLGRASYPQKRADSPH